jgi:hypothetical protein
LLGTKGSVPVSYGCGAIGLGAGAEWAPGDVAGAARAIGARPIEQPNAVAAINDVTYFFVVVFMIPSPVARSPNGHI